VEILDRHRSQLLGGSLSSTGDGSRYDRAYFDKWYRNPRHRVKSKAELERQVRFVLSTTEWVLGRAARTVLDVGCGEGNWRAVLTSLRPGIVYEGIDPSEYAVRKFGKRRNIQLGGIEDVNALAQRDAYDLIVCCGMLNYLAAAQLARGLPQIAARTAGVAYLEIFTSEDSYEGDISWPSPHKAGWYRRKFDRAGLVPIGMQCHVHRSRARLVASLERL
jgi:SAM-dependent methyltransferase